MPAALTVMLVAVTPVFQLNVPLQPLAVKIAVSPEHNVGLLLATIGATGASLGVTVAIFEASLVPQFVIHLAV